MARAPDFLGHEYFLQIAHGEIGVPTRLKVMALPEKVVDWLPGFLHHPA